MQTERLILRQAHESSFAPFGAEILSTTAEPRSGRFPSLLLETETMTTEQAARESRHSDVIAIAPDMPVSLIEPKAVSAKFESDVDGALSTWGLDAIAAPTSHLTGEGITVAVLDTGIDRNHPAFSSHTIVEEDFSGDGTGDINGHGTHCAGTIFGDPVDGKRIGIATGIKKALIGKVLANDGRGGTINSLKAINWAVDNGANVVSMSLGIDFPRYLQRLVDAGIPKPVATSMALEGYRSNLTAYQTLASAVSAQHELRHTCVIIAASGNESRREENLDWVIAAGIPSAARGIVSVGALGKIGDTLSIAPFSNTGVNLVAPGVHISSARAGHEDLIAFSGTSMATPHVAGVACLWAEWLAGRDQLNPHNLNAKLIASAQTQSIEENQLAGDIGLGCVMSPQS